jgi:O-antigen/teichoic acid export membrane protein
MRHRRLITYRGRMKRTSISWLIGAVCAVALLVALIVRPVHWERSALLAIVVGVAAVAFGYWSSRTA